MVRPLHWQFIRKYSLFEESISLSPVQYTLETSAEQIPYCERVFTFSSQSNTY